MKLKTSAKLTTLAAFVLLTGLAFSNLAQERRTAPPPDGRVQSTKISPETLKEISQNQKFRDASTLAEDSGETVDLQAGVMEQDKQVKGTWRATFPVINTKTKRAGVLAKLIYQRIGSSEPEVYFDNGGQKPPANSGDSSTARGCSSWSSWKPIDTRCAPAFLCFLNSQKGTVDVYEKERTCPLIGTVRQRLILFNHCGC